VLAHAAQRTTADPPIARCHIRSQTVRQVSHPPTTKSIPRRRRVYVPLIQAARFIPAPSLVTQHAEELFPSLAPAHPLRPQSICVRRQSPSSSIEKVPKQCLIRVQQTFTCRNVRCRLAGICCRVATATVVVTTTATAVSSSWKDPSTCRLAELLSHNQPHHLSGVACSHQITSCLHTRRYLGISLLSLHATYRSSSHPPHDAAQAAD
jgi:hypothetical protein